MKISIKGIQDNIIVGCHESEKHTKQVIMMDLTCELYDYNWYANDNLAATVDYDKLLSYAKSLLQSKTYNLLEGLSQFIAHELLNQFRLLSAIEVNLVKPALASVAVAEIKVSYALKRSFKVALSLGSNSTFLPQQQLITAAELLAEYVTEIQFAEFYQTKPFGVTEQNDFINTAIIGNTVLLPDQLLAKIKYIEKLMGKAEVMANGPRIIDIDILLFDNLTYQSNFLIIPHKDMHNRDFVLKPLSDIASNWQHPQLKLTVTELYEKLSPPQKTNIIKKVPYYKDATV
jgi:dihydroneopterin aldolase/2-amino-4-hydroxy-6-hydroxymethyldihydropteridine diphosphokinase